jgi:hypothetical protein
MRKSPKSPRILMIGAACTALVVALVASIYVAMPSIRARRAVAKTESLQIGRSTFSEGKQLAEQMEAKPRGACSPAECEWILWIGNIAVPELWRGQGEVFEASFHVKDGLVDQKDFGYWIGFGSIVSGVTVSEKMDWSGRPIETRSDTNFASEGDRSVIHLWLTPRDSTDTRKRYTSFNWNCFWQFHGCEDAHELMPTGDW